jgi:predicted alpha/beta superfamily hydrolase
MGRCNLFRTGAAVAGLLIAGALVSEPACALAAPAEPAMPVIGPSKLPDIRARTLVTRILRSKEGLDYTIFISAPDGAPPPGGFPVLYVLDANAWFGAAAEIVRLNEIESGPAIVVGVGYPIRTMHDARRRGHDFTLGAPLAPQGAYAGTDFGGADAFLEFLKGDLRSEIGKAYPIDPGRQSLFGHSLGGYFVLHALFTAPEAFFAYIAASPAIWWDDKALAAEEQAFLSRPGLSRPGAKPRTQVLITVGGLEQQLGEADVKLMTKLYAANPGAFGGATLAATLAEIRKGQAKDGMIDRARDLAGRLKHAGVPVSFALLADENHRSSVPTALSRTMPLALAEPR